MVLAVSEMCLSKLTFRIVQVRRNHVRDFVYLVQEHFGSDVGCGVGI